MDPIYDTFHKTIRQPLFFQDILTKLETVPCPYKDFKDFTKDVDRIWSQEEKLRKAHKSNGAVIKRHDNMCVLRNMFKMMAAPYEQYGVGIIDQQPTEAKKQEEEKQQEETRSNNKPLPKQQAQQEEVLDAMERRVWSSLTAQKEEKPRESSAKSDKKQVDDDFEALDKMDERDLKAINDEKQRKLLQEEEDNEDESFDWFGSSEPRMGDVEDMKQVEDGGAERPAKMSVLRKRKIDFQDPNSEETTHRRKRATVEFLVRLDVTKKDGTHEIQTWPKRACDLVEVHQQVMRELRDSEDKVKILSIEGKW